MPIDRLTFIYDADGTLVGELKYWFGSWVGATHCALCDITHSKFRKRRSFLGCADRLGVPITYLHRDDTDEALTELTLNKLPCVVGHGSGNDTVLLAQQDLESISGNVALFEARLGEVIALHAAPHSLADSAADGSDATAQ
jgi:hypothetical protein